MALALLLGLGLAPASEAGLTDDLTGPGLVQDLTVDVETLIPAVIADFSDGGSVADMPVTVTVSDEGAVQNLFGSRVTVTVPSEFTVLEDYTDCAIGVEGPNTVTCTVTAADVGTAFNIYLRTSTPGSYAVTADLAVANAAEALVEYDDNNSDSAALTVVDDDSRAVAALEPGECLLVERVTDSDTHETCNSQDPADGDSHPIITTTEKILDTSVYTCNGDQCVSSNGWKTGQILAPGYIGDAGYSIREVARFGVDATPCQGIGRGSDCVRMVHGQNSNDFSLEETPWCYEADTTTYTTEALNDVQCIEDVVKTKVGNTQIRTWILQAKITEDPPKLPLNILSSK